jgi:hypothetical protein
MSQLVGGRRRCRYAGSTSTSAAIREPEGDGTIRSTTTSSSPTASTPRLDDPAVRELDEAPVVAVEVMQAHVRELHGQRLASGGQRVEMAARDLSYPGARPRRRLLARSVGDASVRGWNAGRTRGWSLRYVWSSR